jgi:hypothetical protein
MATASGARSGGATSDLDDLARGRRLSAGVTHIGVGEAATVLAITVIDP